MPAWPDFGSWFGPRLDWIQVEVTTRCNAACVYCPRTVYRDAWQDRDLSLAAYRHWLPALNQARLVHLQGWGEPLLHPEFFTFAALAREAGCRVSTTTNGMLLDEPGLRRLMDAGLEIVAFSLTGLFAGHDRARPGTSFSRVVECIQALNRLKLAAGRATPRIHVAYMLLRSGLADLERLPQVLGGLGIDQVVLSTLDLVPSRDLLGESFADLPMAAYEDVQVRLAAMEAAALGQGLPISYRLPSPGTRAALCPENPRQALCVAADGAVSPCVFTNLPVRGVSLPGRHGAHPYRPLVFGNLGDQRLQAIWRHPAYADFRQSFGTGRLAGSCRPCWKR
jgi:MoaA/NifB/PqqE/SkfB family radical SAM enzyme